jgi:hypothetical protein
MRRVLLIVAFAIAIVCPRSEAQYDALYDTAGPHKKRDLTGYRQKGPFSVGLPQSSQESAKASEEIREFLWTCWQQRERGCVRATYTSTEGEKSNVGYFVEPSDRGIWYVAVEIDREIRTPKGGLAHRSDSYVATIVQRVEREADGMTPLRPIPEDQKRAAAAYQLALRDESGKTLTTL